MDGLSLCVIATAQKSSSNHPYLLSYRRYVDIRASSVCGSDPGQGSSLEWLDVSPPEELEDQEDIGPEILCTTTSASPSRWIDGWMDGRRNRWMY